MSNANVYALGQPLPVQAVVGSLHGWFGYRRYPVFSLPWLVRRTSRFGLVIGGFATLVLIGSWLTSQDAILAVQSAGLFLLSFSLMSFSGPLLACAVRYRRWPLRRERIGVVLAVLVGMGCSAGIDSWASAKLEPDIEQRLEKTGLTETPQAKRARAVERKPLGVALNIAVLVVAYFLLGGGLALRGYFSEQRRVAECQRAAELAELAAARLQAQQSAMRVSLLQAQIAPHFLFNTLASIRALLRRDPVRAEAALDALVDHLRACMPQLLAEGGLPLSSVGRELEACRSYFELMRLRLADRLHYSLHCDAGLEAQPLLPMLLLTLVENAVKHGIELHPGPGEIQVAVARRGSGQTAQLWLTVTDNGVGLQPGLGGGVGLANLREQLRSRHGDTAGLRISSRETGGVCAEIWLPLPA